MNLTDVDTGVSSFWLRLSCQVPIRAVSIPIETLRLLINSGLPVSIETVRLPIESGFP
jgi:hypothetical protein